MFHALGIFLSSLCDKGKVSRILEYTTAPSVLTARFAEQQQNKHFAFVAPCDRAAEVLSVLFGDEAVIVRSPTQLQGNIAFDAIICAPPIGYRTEGQNAGDGFGGEVVRLLIPYLALHGALYWVTARGAIFNSRVENTLDDLRNEGLNAFATIEVAPGGVPGTMIEAVVIGLRREPTFKRFVGALRDIGSARPLAFALLAGPSQKAGANWAWLDRQDQGTFGDLEYARLLQKLTPRGRHSLQTLASLLLRDKIERADKPIIEEVGLGKAANYASSSRKLQM